MIREKVVVINLGWNDSEVVDEELNAKVRYTVSVSNPFGIQR
jgi:hypothetical protein